MTRATSDLQQLKGVGRVLAQRLKGAGIKNCRRITEVGEEGLQKVPGISTRAISSILDQAREFVATRSAAKAERVEALKERIGSAKERVTRLDEETRQRFTEELDSKFGRKLLRDFDKVNETLIQMEGMELKRLKRAERGISKVERRMEGLEEAGIRKVRKAIRKSKKALSNAVT